MNLGISIPETSKASRTISYEELVAMQLETDDFFDHAFDALRASQGLISTMRNVLDIMVTLKRHNCSQESLAVMNDLFRRDFGGSLSIESLAETGRRLREKLRGMREKVRKMIRWLIDKIRGIIFSSEKSAKAAQQKAASADTEKPLTGSFKTFDLTAIDDYSRIISKVIENKFANVSRQEISSQLNEVAGKFSSKTVTWTGENQYHQHETTLRRCLSRVKTLLTNLGEIHQDTVNSRSGLDGLPDDDLEKTIEGWTADLDAEAVYTAVVEYLMKASDALYESLRSLDASWWDSLKGKGQ